MALDFAQHEYHVHHLIQRTRCNNIGEISVSMLAQLHVYAVFEYSVKGSSVRVNGVE